MPTLGVRQLARGLDLGLLTIVVILVLFGLAALYSFSLHEGQPDYTLFVRQSSFAVIGLGLALGLARLDYRYLAGLHWLLYGLGLALLVAVRYLGTTVRGTTGWFEVAGLQFQPVELVKLIVAVVLAKYFADHLADSGRWRLVLTSALIVALPVGLVMAQPDYGSASILLGLWVVLLFTMPIPRRRMVMVGLVLVGLAFLTWGALLQPYQQERVRNLFFPGRDPLGGGYNVRQSVTAIGAGQVFGRGLGLGTQSQLNFLPERQTDFIFASITEELGLVGSLAIVGLFGLLFWRLVRLIRQAQDNFSLLLALALGNILFLQAGINILMNLGLFPVTGLPLPFLSYGGSSLIVSLMAIGLLESMIIRHRTTPL
ncbi:MAG: rod shape-determining protein RodA [Candidatus Kerfeldbacteria bacterium]|nr:rod shape-determining protein RodA [Candidatus Kerfeldbacteria bacterium]